ncbi:YlxQ family RNA-binding protein [Sporolactobacillus sp. THM7-7]|nr:YlxQ family RNA-binding protein [Sporolactobacillus sp. THM7-7]
MARNNNQWQSLLGLAQRAGKVVSGEETVLRTIRENKARAVIMSQDASDRTKKTITNKCRYYRVPLLGVPDRVSLGRSIGRGERVLIAVTDRGFAERLAERLESSTWG